MINNNMFLLNSKMPAFFVNKLSYFLPFPMYFSEF